MTPEQQRIKIAEACGWRIEPTQAKGGWKLYCGDVATSFWWNEKSTPTLSDVARALPDYFDDLNAMHEAEGVIQCGGFSEYTVRLREVVIRAHKRSNRDEITYDMLHATAAQRAEAFLRTLGLWEEKGMIEARATSFVERLTTLSLWLMGSCAPSANNLTPASPPHEAAGCDTATQTQPARPVAGARAGNLKR